MNELEHAYHDVKEIPLDGYHPVIWLASWYPSPTYPNNGDFIQRHAEAIDIPLLVVHTVHDPGLEKRVQYRVSQRGKIREILVCFRQSREGGSVWDRFQYHRRYLHFTRQLIRHIIEKQGKPAFFHVHVPMKMGLLALWAKRKWGIPFVVSEQSSKYVGDGPDHFIRRSSLHRQQVARIFRQASAVTNVSATVGKVLETMFNLPAVTVIHNVVDTTLFKFTARTPHGIFRFLHASTLTDQKNIEGMIRAFDRLYLQRQDFRLTVLGGEPDVQFPWESQRPWLERSATVPHHEVAARMQQADALVMFSRDENFPCVIVEALCAGIPVITSNAGGSAEAITADNGIWVPVGNEDALVSALNSMLDHPHLYQGAFISSEAAKRYSYPVIGNAFIQLYQKMGVLKD
jgi:glycosyltransferase involved in cell wall biosynthesis